MIHDTIKQRLRASLLLALAAKQTLAQATHFAREIGEDGAWPDLDYPLASFRAAPPEHLERTLSLAKALRAAPGMLESPLRRALDFWLANDFQTGDWRWNQISVPRLVGQIALLCENEISAGAWEKVIEILARSRLARWLPGAGWTEWTGADLLGVAYNVILRGCLENTPTLFDAAFSRIFREIRLARPGEDGIQADMSFYAPGSLQPEVVSVSFTRECAQFIALAHGTPWQAPAESLRIFAAYLLDAQQWMIQGTVDGHATTSPDETLAAQRLESLAVAVGQLAQLGNPPRRQELAALSHRLLGRGTPLFGHRYFWRSNLCVHRRPAYYARLQLGGEPADSTSPRAEESGTRGEPQPEGFLAFTRSLSQPEGSPSSQSRRWLPGMTALVLPDGGPVPPIPSTSSARRLAGGISDGEYGLASLRLSSEVLTGKKAWFFFNDSFVCLGSDLRASPGDALVRTSVDERALRHQAIARRTGQPAEILTEQDQRLSAKISRVEHDGYVYTFGDSSTVTLRTELAARPEVSAVHLSIHIEHGTQPQGEKYAYTVFPVGDDPEQRGRIAEEIAHTKILANTPLIQAVRHDALQLTGIVFWEPGVLALPDGGRVAVNQPCLLLSRMSASGEIGLTVANPARQPATVHVEYNGQCLCFELPGGLNAGRSVSRQL